MGRISDTQVHYSLKHEPTKKLLRGDILPADLTIDDLELNLEQKGVDMRIGIDISSLAFKHQVNQIILISGDSDFVPAAKQARREGIDFILDPMRAPIKDDLFEHIDGIRPLIYTLQEHILKTAKKNRPSVTSTETAYTSEDAYIFYVQEYCIIFGQPSQSEHVFDGCYFYT